MTHRSVGVFIILAALLVAVPQASRDLLALAGAAGDQARSAMLRAFLGLNGGPGGAPAADGRRSLLASCKAPASGRRAAPRPAQQQDGRSKQAARESKAGHAAGESVELAMILDEPADAPPADFGRKIEAFEFGRTPAHGPKDAPALSELAMIIPPDTAIPPVAAAVKGELLKARSALAAAETNPQIFVAARFSGEAARLRVEDVRREIVTAGREAATAAARDEARLKARAPRPAPKKPADPTACGVPQFIKVAVFQDAPAPAGYVALGE